MNIQSVNDKKSKVMVWMSVPDLYRLGRATVFYKQHERECNQFEKDALRSLEAKFIKLRAELEQDR